MSFESDDFLWQSNSPTQQDDNNNKYVYRLRFDGDVYSEHESYEDAVDRLKFLIKMSEPFDICQIEQYEINFHDTKTFYTLEKNEYIQKVWRFIELESAQWELSSDELVEKNQLRTYLNFKL
jgi:hypothetical protein